MMKDSKDSVVCRCEEVYKSEILEGIHKGDRTLEAIKKRTRCGMGLCQGKTCGRLAAQLLATELEMPLSALPPPGKRPPVGAISIAALAGEEEG